MCNYKFEYIQVLLNVFINRKYYIFISRYTGQTMTSGLLVLIALAREDNYIGITVNCEKLVIGSMLLSEIKTALQNS